MTGIHWNVYAYAQLDIYTVIYIYTQHFLIILCLGLPVIFAEPMCWRVFTINGGRAENGKRHIWQALTNEDL